MDKIDLIKQEIQKATEELRSQLAWYNYVFDTKARYYYSKHNIQITGDLRLKIWWFVLIEIK